MASRVEQRVMQALERLRIELPSWGFADTGTRFGKFHQPAAASTIDEKLHDAGLVNKLTGACPKVAVHVLWDFVEGEDPRTVAATASRHGVAIGSINPNLFQDQVYKFGSLCSPDPQARDAAEAHIHQCIDIAKAVDSPVLSLWLADGTNYPGQDSIRRRKRALQQALKSTHDAFVEAMGERALMLVEYKPFEPAFYHTDIADWGMAYVLSKHAGPAAKVLVDTGHHLPGCNIEHLVAFLLDEGMLGGFHFNDRKYADDDLTLGSIDPYAVFRIFVQIALHEHETGQAPAIEYMVDQSHNLKPKLEAMVQTVATAQMLYAKAYAVDFDALLAAQQRMDVTEAELILQRGFAWDADPLLRAFREGKGAPGDPLAALRESGIIAELGAAREAARAARGEQVGSSYA